MEQLEAFRQKKAAERRDRLERIQKRLQEVRDKVATVAYNNSARGGSAARLPTDNLLKDSTNRVNSSTAKRELSSRARAVARSLKQPATTGSTAAGRHNTVTLSSNNEVKDSAETAANENAPECDDVSSDIKFSQEKNFKSALSKRYIIALFSSTVCYCILCVNLILSFYAFNVAGGVVILCPVCECILNFVCPLSMHAS